MRPRGKPVKPDEPMSLGLQALAAMHDTDRARGIDPFSAPRSPDPPALPVVTLPIPPPPWSENFDPSHPDAAIPDREVDEETPA